MQGSQLSPEWYRKQRRCACAVQLEAAMADARAAEARAAAEHAAGSEAAAAAARAERRAALLGRERDGLRQVCTLAYG